jgi:quercetin dioxygenase-like cupin family protein
MKYIASLFLIFMTGLFLSITPANAEDIKKYPERDYTVTAPVIPVDPAILSDSDTPWEELGNGTRRKVFFNDRITFVILEVNRPVEKEGEIVTHSHPHDQVSYVLKGKIRVKVGKEEKIIEEGGVYIVPSNVPHGIQILSDQVLLMDMFTPTREDIRKK